MFQCSSCPSRSLLIYLGCACLRLSCSVFFFFFFFLYFLFPRNDGSLRHLLALISKFGICSGLVINFYKTEMFILGNSVMAPARDQSIMNIGVKRAVKILGVYFTYDRRLRHKLNFKEIIDAIKTKL